MSRRCSSCTACCTVLGVEEIAKQEGVRCGKLTAAGCSIYDDRPGQCRDFECVWLQDAEGRFTRNMERPDLSGVLLHLTAGEPQAIVARPVRKGAFQESAADELLARLARRAPLIIVGEGERRLVGPAELVQRFRSGREKRQ